jgi:hypothetical protein
MYKVKGGMKSTNLIHVSPYSFSVRARIRAINRQGQRVSQCFAVHRMESYDICI